MEQPLQLPEGRSFTLRVLHWLNAILFIALALVPILAFVFQIEYFGVLATVLALSGVYLLAAPLLIILSIVGTVLELRHIKRAGHPRKNLLKTGSLWVLIAVALFVLFISFGL